MPLPLAAAAFCITTFACAPRKTKSRVGDFFKSDGCSFFVDDASNCDKFEVGANDMSSFIVNQMKAFPVVTSVNVDKTKGEFLIEVTVDRFDWASLEGIYAKELDLLHAFKDQSLNFQVIDGSAEHKADDSYIS